MKSGLQTSDDLTLYRRRIVVGLSVLVALQSGTSVMGSPCTDGTNSCDAATQICKETNSTARFACECKISDYQLGVNQTCVKIPRLYLTTTVNTSEASVLAVFNLLNNPDLSTKSIEALFKSVTLPTYKTAKFEEFITLADPHLRVVVYSVLFTEEITDEMREAVAKAVLEMEKKGNLSTVDGSLVAPIVGYTGIFNTRTDATKSEDNLDWCAFPSLYSCRNHSRCVDVGFRYKCPCDTGYFEDGSMCSSLHANCQTRDGGIFCVCKSTAAIGPNGTCTGPTILGPSEFETDGSRNLELKCDPGDVLELSSITWNIPCLQRLERICVIKPQPPWDDGKSITCTAAYTDRQNSSFSYALSLHYPPTSPPAIEGYQDGLKLTLGSKVKMLCSVSGGKPLVNSVNFSCPGHPDKDLDLVSETAVRSVLEIDPVVPSDDGLICTCSAKWKSSLLYTLTTSRVLAANDQKGSYSSNEISDTFIIIVASVGGGVIIVFIIVVVIIWKIRGSASTGSAAPSSTAGTLSTVSHGNNAAEQVDPGPLPMRHNVHNPMFSSGENGDVRRTGTGSGVYDYVTTQQAEADDLYIHAVTGPSADARVPRGQSPSESRVRNQGPANGVLSGYHNPSADGAPGRRVAGQLGDFDSRRLAARPEERERPLPSVRTSQDLY